MNNQSPLKMGRQKYFLFYHKYYSVTSGTPGRQADRSSSVSLILLNLQQAADVAMNMSGHGRNSRVYESMAQVKTEKMIGMKQVDWMKLIMVAVVLIKEE
ncbi:hypothetical protein CRENBAI_007689 [Crenichthys baileyi]|uniref:Uncharacterized protein n=1 Tax=Crenichthys baileyi TaxID=28760 RepID=A0AAV9SDL1_9TELE